MKKKKLESNPLELCIIDIAVEDWRFGKVFKTAMSKLDTENGTRYYNQYSFFHKKVEAALSKAGLKTVNIESQLFDIGMAAIPLNLDDFDKDELLYVEQMIEPIIMKDGIVLREGKVTLRRAEQ